MFLTEMPSAEVWELYTGVAQLADHYLSANVSHIIWGFPNIQI